MTRNQNPASNQENNQNIGMEETIGTCNISLPASVKCMPQMPEQPGADLDGAAGAEDYQF
jgi:hypothetical protein